MKLEDTLGEDRDNFYEALLKAHGGLGPDESQALNARLVLILANEIGDVDRLTTLLQEARSIS